MKKNIWLNGKIYTANQSQKWAESIITKGNKIIFVGGNDDAKELAGDDSDIHDFGGKLVVPGFIDSHVHLIIGGLSLTKLDMGEVRSKEDFRNSLNEFLTHTNSEWITGGNWNHLQFDKKVLPTKDWIDDLTDKPIYLTRIDIHTVLVNSAALKLAGISKNTQAPEGGQIIKDEYGEPTGILKDTAMNLVLKLIPEPREDELVKSLTAAQNLAHVNGITSVHDITEQEHYNLYKKYKEEQKLKLRINCIHPISRIEQLIDINVFNEDYNEYIRNSGVKAFADGTLGSNTAWFFEPYQDEPTTTGLSTDYMVDGKFREWALLADKNKIQLVVHAIGDRAVSEVLNVFEEIVETNPSWDRRFRIEHVQHIRFEDIARMKKLNVIASMQPSQLFDDGVWAEDKIGKDRLKGTHAVNTLLENGIRVCLGSDWTVTPLDVIHGIDIAVNRRLKDNSLPNGWIPEEKISIEQAVNSYTIDAAYASFEENLKGSIEVGKLADFVVLNENVFELPSTEIANTKVAKTIFDGELVYSI